MKTSIPKLPIRELVSDIETWDPRQSPSNTAITYIDISSVDRDSKQIASATKVNAHEAPSRARQLVSAGDVVVSTVRPNLNAVAEVSKSLDGATASTGFTVLRPIPSRIQGRYLYHWVRGSEFVAEMARLATGASYPAVTDRIVKDSLIPLPSIPEQRRIAAILDKADALREKRRQAIAKLDTLLQSVFLEMFGDPVTNPKGWTTAQLGEVAEIASGAMKGRKFNGQATVLMPYLRVANVQDGFIDLREVKEIEVLATDIERYRLQPGDVLMTEGGDPDKLGRGAIWRGEIPNCLHQNHIFRVRLNHRYLLPEFLSGLIGSERGKRYFLREAKQTTGIATINMTQLRAFPVLLPPFELQQKYLKFVEMLQFLAIKITRSAEKHEELFRAIQQRAFTGQLFTEKAAAAAQQELFAD